MNERIETLRVTQSVPLVSVAMISYNHRPYIAQALGSVVAQQCRFPIEIVISDDVSPDGTASIVGEYASRHPHLIRHIDPTHNIGMHANFDRVWRACNGKYIAILEGDDYWTDPFKLTKQVEFLEARPAIVACGHAVTTVMPDGTAGPLLPVNLATIPRVADTVTLLKHGNILPTCSTLYRRGPVPHLSPWVSRTGFVDYALLLLQSLHGRVALMEDTMACYRVHTGGAWSTAGSHVQISRELRAMTIMLAEESALPRPVRAALKARIHMLSNSLRDEAYEARLRGDHHTAWRLHRELLAYRYDFKDMAFALTTAFHQLRTARP
jgi:glycosyltransferase involved in cell wall biosynthesis